MTLELLKRCGPTGQIAPLGNADLSIRAIIYDYIGAIDDALHRAADYFFILLGFYGLLWF
jgi:hypothetical protein